MYIIQILFIQLCLYIYFTMYCSTGKHLCLPLIDLNRSKLYFICVFLWYFKSCLDFFYSIIMIMVLAVRGGIDQMCFIKVFVIFLNFMLKKKNRQKIPCFRCPNYQSANQLKAMQRKLQVWWLDLFYVTFY